MQPDFEPRRYWDERHRRESDLDAVGFLGLGAFNHWAYRVRAHLFRRLLSDRAVDVRAARVLDVGSGTGFYLELWRALSPRALVGADLAPSACARLRERLPGIPIHELDLGEEWSSAHAALGQFELISVMDVLYHVVDDAAYHRAFLNLRRLLAPGGALIFTENFLRGRPRAGNAWQVSRTAQEIEAELAGVGLALRERRPWFVLMNNPIDSDSRALRLYWRALDRLLRRSDLLGHVAGATLLPLELALTKVLPEGPSSKLAWAERRP